LGATSLQTLELIIRQGMKPVLIGSAIGLLAAAGVSVLMSNLLYGLSPVDPLSYLLAVLMVALVAILIPAQRAARVDSMVALRGDQ
jgi:putative ABC transport system permease protein